MSRREVTTAGGLRRRAGPRRQRQRRFRQRSADVVRPAAVMFPLLALALAIQDPLHFVPAGRPIPVGPLAGRPVLADMNGDRKPDVVVACGTCCGSPADPASGHVVVLLGDGKGGFTPAEGSPHKVESSTRKVVVGDVNGDRRTDVVAASHDSDDVVVLFGDGAGGLTTGKRSTFHLGKARRAHTHDVVLGDVDRDGKLDVLATQSDAHRVAILHGDGQGGFGAAVHVVIGRHPYDAIELVDVDRDERPDLVVPDLLGKAVSVCLQDGAGRYRSVRETPERQFAVGERPGYVLARDVDGDGDVDVVVTRDDAKEVVVLLGDGKGGFSRGAGVELDGMPWGIAAADLDGDGDVDFAFGGMDDTVHVARGDGRGGLQAAGAWQVGRAAHYVAAGDVDGDGRPDLVATSYGEGTVVVLRNARR
jgi:hypothetical protein